MNREKMRLHLENEAHWDLIIIGGGATGLGTAIDAASRGFKTLLAEQDDFAKGTSSRSTKLLHGGVRYLAQGNFKLVMDALKERGYLIKNAPHVSDNCSFVIPVYKWWEKWYFGAGLIFYDVMAGKLGLGKTSILSVKKTSALLPTIKKDKLKGGISYQDGQFDDSRLAINMAQTAAEQGATLLNYCKLTGFNKTKGKITAVELTDTITRKKYLAHSRMFINATGVFSDAVLAMDEPGKRPILSPSQGVHVVIDKKFFTGDTALMIPATTDGRVLFAVPWHGKVVVGTTDTAIENISAEPVALEEEIDFILRNLNAYLGQVITRPDILSVFAGLRPLVRTSAVHKTSLMPRDHVILVSSSGLISITGGKWTTYRKMAEDVINKACALSGMFKRKCITTSLKIHGWSPGAKAGGPLEYYGSDLGLLEKLYEENPAWRELLHPGYPYTQGCVILATRNEMAQTAEDILARRTRLLFLDARAAMQTASRVIQLMATEMNKDEQWITEQTASFDALAKNYLA